MSATQVQRLRRLQELSALMAQEIASLAHEMEHGDTLVPASAASSVGLDLQVLMDQVVPPLAAELKETMESIWGGHTSCFLKYLSPTIIQSGRGLIKPSVTFKQYDEDVMKAHQSRLSGWPEGFYRNKDTKEEQLMIRLKSKGRFENAIISIDSLPSITGDFVITMTLEDKKIRQFNLIDFPVAQMKELKDAIEETLETLTKEEFFTDDAS